MSIVNKTFGQVRGIPRDVEDTRTIPVTLSTPTRDRHHTILNQNNWQLENYRKNPVVGYMHNLYGDLCNAPNPDDVIAQDKGIKMENTSGKPELIGYPSFEPAELNVKAEKIFRKILLGTLRGVSVGFLDIGKGQWGTGDEAEGRDNETYYFAGQELLEYSIVNIPSNPDGTKRAAQQAMRDQTYSAIMYCFRELGRKYRLSEIESMSVGDVLTLLDGRDLDIKAKDPRKVAQMLSEISARNDIDEIIEKQQIELKKRLLKNL